MGVIRVLHVGEYVQGGVATYIKTLLAHREADIEDYLVLARDKSDPDWPLPKERVFFYPYQRGLGSVLPAMRYIIRVIDVVKPDVIYCHSTWAGVLGRFPFLFQSKRPRILYNAHGWAFLRDTASWKRQVYALVERLLAHVTDTIINVSNNEQENALRYGLPKEKLHRVYSGIESEKGAIEGTPPFDTSKLNLLFVGRLDPQKGADLLIRAMEAVSREDIHLTVIGAGVTDGGVECRQKDNITFLGWVDHKDLARYYACCDAVVMPSRWEAFGLVALEAMKYGKPVIASPVGALPELIQTGENGLLVDFHQAEALLQVNDYLSKNTLARMGKVAEKVFTHFTADSMRKETFSLYRDGKSL